MFSDSLPTTGSPKRRIGVYVTVVHLILIGWYSMTATPPDKKSKRHAVTVTTYRLTPTIIGRDPTPSMVPPLPQAKAQPARNAPLPNPSRDHSQGKNRLATTSPPDDTPHIAHTEGAIKPKAHQANISKNSPPTPPSTRDAAHASGSPKPPKTSSSHQQEVRGSRRAELVKQMEASLSSLQSLGASTPKAAPMRAMGAVGAVGTLASESLPAQAPSYYDRLISFLENRLILPEEGEVKVLLTLAPNGTIKELVIKESASARNRAYIEQHMPPLQLPPLDSTFKEQTKHTFTITLTSS